MTPAPPQPGILIAQSERLRLIVPDATLAKGMRDYAVRNREFHRPAMPTPPPEYTETGYWRRRLKTRLAQFKRGELFGFLMLAPTSLEILGDFTFSQVFDMPQRSAVLGYKLDQTAEGKGLMFEALTLGLEWAWSRAELHRVEANVRPENLRSLQLLLRLGFKIEGFSPSYLHLDGAWRDHLRLAIVNPEHLEG